MNIRFLAVALLATIGCLASEAQSPWRREHRPGSVRHENRAGHNDLHGLSAS